MYVKNEEQIVERSAQRIDPKFIKNKGWWLYKYKEITNSKNYRNNEFESYNDFQIIKFGIQSWFPNGFWIGSQLCILNSLIQKSFMNL